MNNPKEIEIDGESYLIGLIPPRESAKLLNRILHAVGPALGSLLMKSPTGKDGTPELSAEAIIDGARSLFTQLTPDEQDRIMVELFSNVKVLGGEKPVAVMQVFNTHFAGRLPAIFKLMWACMEANYGDFTAAIAAFGKRAMARVSNSETSSTSPIASSSGAS